MHVPQADSRSGDVPYHVRLPPRGKRDDVLFLLMSDIPLT